MDRGPDRRRASDLGLPVTHDVFPSRHRFESRLKFSSAHDGDLRAVEVDAIGECIEISGMVAEMTESSGKADRRTRGTLLSRVRDLSDTEAWKEFVSDYGPLILNWCARHGLQEADCADVVQDVLSRLVTAMRDFQYDPGRGRFRGWLKTVTQNAVIDFVKARNRAVEGSGDSDIGRMLTACESPDSVADLVQALERQAEVELLREAEARVRLRVKPHNFEAWRLSLRENLKAPEIASQLKMEVADVYVARSRINKMLREEIARLDGLTLEPVRG